MERASSVRAPASNTKTDSARRNAASAKLKLIKRGGSDPKLSAAAHQVLSLMVNWADVDGRVSNKSINFIAADVDRNRATVIRAVAQLCERGFLERIGQHNDIGNAPNNYWLCFDINKALRANARENDRRQRDKKRAPHHRKTPHPPISPACGAVHSSNSGLHATLKVAQERPSESHHCDTNIPYSSPSLPYCEDHAVGKARNSSEPLNGGLTGCRAIGAILSRSFSSPPDGSHSRNADERDERSMGNPKAPTPQEDHKASFTRTEAAQRAQIHFLGCQARVNRAIAEHDAWELISIEDLNAAFKAEIEAKGTGVSRIRDILGRKQA